MPSSPTPNRQRARIACKPCRERKRKCDGDQPCSLCRGFGYECEYRTTPRKRRRTTQAPAERSIPTPTTPQAHGSVISPSQATEPDNAPAPPAQPLGNAYVRSVESNSGAAFMRTLAMAMDPNNAPPFQLLAWNLFMGERHQTTSGPNTSLLPQQSITDLLSLVDMYTLTNIYFTKVDPCYGFIEKDQIEQIVANRWSAVSDSTRYDAVLCGVAALGCLFHSDLPSNLLETEPKLVALAKSLLTHLSSANLSVHDATGWILRTVYLRLTGRPDEAWMASCTTMHIVDAVGIHYENPSSTIMRSETHNCSPDIRRRIFGVAQHLNIWMSFDLARSRVILQKASTTSSFDRPGDYTTELLGLLPYSEKLDPSETVSGDELSDALAGVLDRSHSRPPSVLAQCNLMLCIYRRLHALEFKIQASILEKVLLLIKRGLDAVHAITSYGSPWHHAGNVPFQSICVLLAVDSPESLALLGDAIATLVEIDQVYGTKATREAIVTARSLIFMHQKRREADVQRQTELLKLYPTTCATGDAGFEDFIQNESLADFSWFNDFATGIDFGDMGMNNGLLV